MATLCPNKKHPDYEKLVKQIGEVQTFKLWNQFEGNIKKIKAAANQIADGVLKPSTRIVSSEESFQTFVDTNLEPLITRITSTGSDMRAVLTRLHSENIDSNSKGLIEKLLQKVSPFVYVDFSSTANSGAENGRYDNGLRKVNVYSKNLNMKYANPQEALLRTVIHEAAHSLISARANLFLQGKTEHLTAEEHEGLKQLHEMYGQLKPKSDGYYGLSSFPEFLEQVISNPQMVNTVNDLEKGFFGKIWDSVLKLVNTILGLDTDLANKAKNIMSSLVGSYNETQENIIKDYLQNVYDYSKTVAPITDLKDISTLRNADEVNHFTQEEKEATKYLRLLTTPGEREFETQTIKIGNREISFAGLSKQEDILAKINKEIIEPRMELEKNTSSNLVAWLNDGGKADNFKDHFPPQKYGEEHFREIANRISSDHLGFNPVTDKAILFDSEEAKQLGFHREGFVGNNPVIVIHGHRNGTNKISIIDLTYNQISDTSKESLFKFASPAIKSNGAYRAPFMNSEVDYRKFCLTAQIMAMKEKNPDLQVKRALVGQLEARVEGTEYKAPFKSSYIEMNNQIAEVKNLIKDLDLMAALGEVGKVLQNEDLHEASSYQSSYMHYLLNHYKGATELVNSGLEWDGISTWNYGERGGKEHIGKASLNNLESAVQKLVDEPVKNKEWLQILKARLTYIQNSPNTEGVKEEMKLLSGAILEVQNHLYKGNGFIADAMNVADTHLTSPQNWKHPVLQFARRVVEKSYFKMNEQFNTWMASMKESTEEFNKFLHAKDSSLFGKERTMDVSKDRFKGLIKYRDFQTKDGVTVRRPTFEFHTDLNNTETQDAIARGETTKAEVEFATKWNSTLKAQMLKNLEDKYIHEKLGLYWGAANEESFDKYRAEAKEKAAEILQATWKDGTLPVITKTTMELMFSKDIKKGFSQWAEQMTEPNRIFEDFKKDFVGTNAMMHQMTHDTERLKTLGLYLDKSGKILAEEQDPDLASFDLELTMKYFMMMSMRTNEFNKNVLPELNAAKIMLASYQEDPEVMKNAIKTLHLYRERLVEGKSEKLNLPVSDTANVNIDKAISGVMRLMPFAAFTWSIPTGIAAFVQNYTSLLTTSFANRVGGGDLFGPAEALKASKELFFNSNKVEALMKYYQLADVSPDELVHGTRKGFHTDFQKHVFTQHAAQYFSWKPDYMARATVSIAQMIKDGTYDAHIIENGQVVGYDNSKDARWSGKNGKELKSYYTKALKEQGLLAEDATEPNRAYDIQGAMALKDISSQKIVGGYGQLEQTNLGYGILGRGFKSTRNYIFNKWTNLYQHGFYRDSSGRPVFNEETGQMEIQPEFFEGKINSLMRAKDVIMDSYHSDKSVWTGLKAMPTKSKQNIAQLSADTALALIAYMLYRGLTDKDDEDEELNLAGKFALTRFGKSMAYGVYDLTAEWNPAQLLQSLQTPFAVMPYLKNTLDFGTSLITFDAESALHKSGRVLPLGSTIVGISDLFELSK